MHLLRKESGLVTKMSCLLRKESGLVTKVHFVKKESGLCIC